MQQSRHAISLCQTNCSCDPNNTAHDAGLYPNCKVKCHLHCAAYIYIHKTISLRKTLIKSLPKCESAPQQDMSTTQHMKYKQFRSLSLCTVGILRLSPRPPVGCLFRASAQSARRPAEEPRPNPRGVKKENRLCFVCACVRSDKGRGGLSAPANNSTRRHFLPDRNKRARLELHKEHNSPVSLVAKSFVGVRAWRIILKRGIQLINETVTEY